MYKIGDKVKIRKDLEGWQEYGGLTFIGGYMGQYLGKDAMIIGIDYEVLDGDIAYTLDIDNEEWFWSKKMFDELNKVNSYIIVFQSHDSIKINIVQDINRPNNQDDYSLILDYIYFNYGCVAFEIIELDAIEEINI